MKAKVIKTASEYAAALARIDKLMDAKANTPQGEELELLSLLVHEYEENVPILGTRRPARNRVPRFKAGAQEPWVRASLAGQ